MRTCIHENISGETDMAEGQKVALSKKNVVIDQAFISTNYFLILVKLRWYKSNVLVI